VVVLGEMHLVRILASYFEYYNRTRCPQALAGDAPEPRPTQLPEQGRVLELPEVAGCIIDTSEQQLEGSGRRRARRPTRPRASGVGHHGTDQDSIAGPTTSLPVLLIPRTGFSAGTVVELARSGRTLASLAKEFARLVIRRAWIGLFMAS